MNHSRVKLALWTFILIFFSNPTGAAELTGRYVSRYESPGHPSGISEFGSMIEIRQISATKAHLFISILGSTAGGSCSGEIKGPATIKNNLVTYIHDRSPDACRIVVQVSNKKASVIREENCTGRHSGPSCAFSELATNLKYVGPPRQKR